MPLFIDLCWRAEDSDLRIMTSSSFCYKKGHQHNYERFWPMMNGAYDESYSNPGKPVHIVTGSGGAYSKDPFTGPIPAGDAFRSEEWSFSDILVNRSHFWLRQRLATDGSVIDNMVLTNGE